MQSAITGKGTLVSMNKLISKIIWNLNNYITLQLKYFQINLIEYSNRTF